MQLGTDRNYLSLQKKVDAKPIFKIGQKKNEAKWNSEMWKQSHNK